MASSETGAAGSMWWQPLFADSGRTRLWALVSAGFLIVGCLSLGERAWTLFVDWRARQTWPNADGEIIAATQQNDSDLSRKYGTIRGRTRYWVEYDVRFAGPPRDAERMWSRSVCRSQCLAGASRGRAARHHRPKPSSGSFGAIGSMSM